MGTSENSNLKMLLKRFVNIVKPMKIIGLPIAQVTIFLIAL